MDRLLEIDALRDEATQLFKSIESTKCPCCGQEVFAQDELALAWERAYDAASLAAIDAVLDGLIDMAGALVRWRLSGAFVDLVEAERRNRQREESDGGAV